MQILLLDHIDRIGEREVEPYGEKDPAQRERRLLLRLPFPKRTGYEVPMQ